MKVFLLSAILFLSLHLKAQKQVQWLPAGKYETIINNNKSKWEQGDIILMDENKYKLSTGNETGAYRFSTVAQRVFFISGPLKNMYAKTSLRNNWPAIVLPVAENEQNDLKLSSEVWCYYKH